MGSRRYVSASVSSGKDTQLSRSDSWVQASGRTGTQRPLPRYYHSGQYGDQRETKASTFIRKRSAAGDPEATLDAFEDFHRRNQRLIHVGPEKGQRLDEAVLLNSPTKVLEIGAYLGYSAIRIARLLHDGAHLYSIEQNEENARLTEGNVAHTGLGHRVTVLSGTPLTHVQWLKTHAPFDFVFMDHKKLLYLEEIQRLERWGVVQSGTVVVADNIGGRKNKEFNCGYADYVRKSGRYESQFYWGTRDGIEVSKAVHLAGNRAEHALHTMAHATTIDARGGFQMIHGEAVEVDVGTVGSFITKSPRRRWVPKLRHHPRMEETDALRDTVGTNGAACARNGVDCVSLPRQIRVWKKQEGSSQTCRGCQEQSLSGVDGQGHFANQWFCDSCWKAWESESAD